MTGSKKLQARLAQLHKNEIIKMVAELHGRHADTDACIDRYLLKNNPEALSESLLRSIRKVSRSRQFVEYSASFSFAAQLGQLLEDIRSSLLPGYPLTAIQIIPEFISIQDKVLLRCDDSAGVVHDVFSEAAQLLLSCIRLARKQEDFAEGYWLAQFDQWRKHDPYQTYLEVLSQGEGAFTEGELRRLAWRFKHQLQSPDSGQQFQGEEELPQHSAYYLRSLQEARLGLRSVAKALRQADLYEQAVLLGQPRANVRDFIDIASAYLEFGQPGQALQILEKVEQADKHALELMLQAHRMTGDVQQQRDTQSRLFDLEPSTENFQALLALTPPDEQERTINIAIAKAEKADNGTLAANLLLELGHEQKALNLLLKMGSQLNHYYYGDLLALAENFKERQVPLGTVICYRALLEDILNRAYSKAYVYAADYVQSLLEMDQQCEDYAHLPNHSQYLHELRQHHKDKPGFWNRVEGSVLLKGI